jgi:hypothetical protein
MTATQEQELNKQTGIYLDAIEKESYLLVVAKTHPDFVKYAKEKGDDYFKSAFENNGEEQVIFSNPIMEQVQSDDDDIQVLYSVDKEYILKGESEKQTIKMVALSQDNGKTWFFLNPAAYKNKKIKYTFPKLLNF